MNPSRQRALLGISLVVVAAVAAALALRRGSDAPLRGPSSARAPEVSPAHARPVDDDPRAGPPSEAPARAPLPAAAAPPALVIRVVDEQGGPLPGAEVGVHVERTVDDYVIDALREERARTAGVLIADAAGEVRTAVEDVLSWTLYGRQQGRWGVLFVPFAAAGQVQELVLRRDLTVRARVIDAAGRPVIGVPVAFGDGAEVARFRGHATQETVAPDGIATFAHAQRSIRPEWGDDGVVMVGAPLGDAVYARVDLTAPSPEPYLLQLPATGGVRVTLVDAQQQPIEGLSERVYARWHERVDAGERVHRLPFDGARLEVGHVGLGLRCRLELSSAEVVGTVEFDGPRVSGELVEVSLTATRQPTMSGRLVDARGMPQAGYWFATHVQESAGFYNQYFETGDDGLFHTPIPEMTWAQPSARSVLFRRTVPDLEQQAWFDLANLSLHEGRNELGDVVLRPPPLIAAGRVVDDRRAPVAGAVLAVWQGEPEDDAWPVGGVNDHEWVSDADGRFEVRGHLRAVDLLLRAEWNGTHGGLLPFVAGSPAVEYVVPRVGAVAMPVTFAGGLTADRVLFVSRNEATGVTRSLVSHYVFEGGVVTWRGLAPGRYDFGVRALGNAEMLVRRDGVEVRGGETTQLPAQEIGGEVQRIVVRVVDREGAPVERASVVVDPERLAGQPRAALPADLGELELLTPRVPVDLLVFAPGFRTARVPGVGRDVTVRMEPGHLVELVVDLPEGFPPPDQQLMPRVRRYDASDPDPQPWEAGHDLYLRGAGSTYYPSRHPWLWDQRRPLGRDGHLELRVPGLGEYVIEWELRGARRRDLTEDARRVFSVREGELRTRVEVALSAADVRAQ